MCKIDSIPKEKYTHRAWVEEQFQAGLNCSQIVSLYFAQKYGYKGTELVKQMCGFGGGMRQGEVCGAVTGAIAVIGMKYGNEEANDTTSKYCCYEKTVEFEKEFCKRKGSLICRDLLKCDISTEEGMNLAKENNIFPVICPEMISCAIEILIELGY